MSVNNRLQFAVVREDPRAEIEIIKRHGSQRLLLTLGGGCTALALRGAFAQTEITLVDPNPAQFAHFEQKLLALSTLHGEQRAAAFNIGPAAAAQGLSECGNFESLFRGLRGFIHDFVMPYSAWVDVFERRDAHAALLDQAFCNPYWPVAFELFLADSLLNTMFGPDATQHAVKGSYPRYFQSLFESGLRRADANCNPFLHHVFLGHYREQTESWPQFLQYPDSTIDAASFIRFHGVFQDIGNLAQYDFVNFSNVLDWSAAPQVAALCDKLSTLRTGAVVMWRQLNNPSDIGSMLAGAFQFDRQFERELQKRERSLFYSSVHIGVRL